MEWEKASEPGKGHSCHLGETVWHFGLGNEKRGLFWKKWWMELTGHNAWRGEKQRKEGWKDEAIHSSTHQVIICTFHCEWSKTELDTECWLSINKQPFFTWNWEVSDLINWVTVDTIHWEGRRRIELGRNQEEGIKMMSSTLYLRTYIRDK